MTQARFELRARKPYAFDASMLELLFGWNAITPNADTADASATVVTIEGPLCGGSGDGWDSYSAIGERFDAAIAAPTRAVVLRICSPGGDASGAPELARAMRQRADLARKPVYAYVDERACSAAYAIASAADAITVAETAFVGSIGIITTRVDLTAANAARGVRVDVFASGKRKADGHPDTPIDEGEVAATQAEIDRFAQIYFELVAERRGLAVDQVRGLEAGIYQGTDAVSVGLANNVEPYAAFMARIANGNEITMTPAEKAKKALEEMAGSGDPAEAARGKRALEAFDAEEHEEPDGDEPASEEPDGDEDKSEGEPDPNTEDEPTEDKAEDDVPPKDDDKKPEDDKAQAAAAAVSRKEFQALVARIDRNDRARDADERKRLLASRPDLTGASRKALSDPKLPIETLRTLVQTLPKGRTPVTAKQAAAAADAKPTQGDTQGELQGPRLPPNQKAQMDEIMGLTEAQVGIVNTPDRQILGARLSTATKR